MSSFRERAIKGVSAAIVATVALAGCGGSDDVGPPPPETQVSFDASQTVAGFIGYLQLLIASNADMLEPVETSYVTPPTDDTSEPVAIN